MSVYDELSNLNNYMYNCYDTINTMGGTIPASYDMNSLPSSIASIPSGGGSDYPLNGHWNLYHDFNGTGLKNLYFPEGLWYCTRISSYAVRLCGLNNNGTYYNNHKIMACFAYDNFNLSGQKYNLKPGMSLSWNYGSMGRENASLTFGNMDNMTLNIGPLYIEEGYYLANAPYSSQNIKYYHWEANS